MKYAILIIDDEDRIRDIFKRSIQAASMSCFNILEAESAQKALELIFRYDIDLVLLDIRMPGIDGARLFRAIRKYAPDLKVIVASVCPIEEQQRLVPAASDYYDKSQGAIPLLNKVVQVFA